MQGDTMRPALSNPLPPEMPRVLGMRERDAVTRPVIAERLDTILPLAMREGEIDMWLILCQEDDLDPVFRTMMPLNTWCPILQMLVLYRNPGDGAVERINLSMTRTQGLFQEPWTGRGEDEQWAMLARLVAERDPARIGINIGSVQWAAGGLTHNLYTRLVRELPAPYPERLVSAEAAVTRWLETLTAREIALYEHVTRLAHALLAECYSPRSVVPGLTTTEDLEWRYWQLAADLGLEVSFKPFFNLVRGPQNRERYGEGDRVIRPGDAIHSDVGVRYLGLTSDHQEWAYVLCPGEEDAPEGLRRLLAAGNRLQDVYMASFERGLTGDELLARILARAREVGIPKPRVYSHSLGHLLHEPGPLIGLPWEQERNPGRGDVRLEYDTAFTMELSVADAVPEWGGQEVTLSIEEDVVFTTAGCRALDGRQLAYYLL
jgi:Xaa-Pro aminopeptidase